ncbi:hypothetical protein ACLOAV_004663 [Pseudogymnoascus australis]
MISLPAARRAGLAGVSLLRPMTLAVNGRNSWRRYHESAKVNAAAAAMAVPITAQNQVFMPAMPTAPAATPVPALLNIKERSLDPEFYKAVSKIMEIRSKYVRDRFVFTEGAEMIPLLRALGAADEDFSKLKKVSDLLEEDPTLPFRKSTSGRFSFDPDTETVRRLERQSFSLSVEEDFKRYDSGKIRYFDEIADELHFNTAFQALLVFKAALIHGIQTTHRPMLAYEKNSWVCTMFNLRTITTPNMVGEPALEGVHTDGVDHTLTTFLGSNNMGGNSGVSFLHELAEETGTKVDDTKTLLLRGRAHHRHFLDTLVIVDHDLKHSISPVYAVDPTREATRDMFILFTRKPANPEHISGSIDSQKSYERLPMEIPMFVPGR